MNRLLKRLFQSMHQEEYDSGPEVESSKCLYKDTVQSIPDSVTVSDPVLEKVTAPVTTQVESTLVLEEEASIASPMDQDQTVIVEAVTTSEETHESLMEIDPTTPTEPLIEPPQATEKKPANDPYAGYLAPNGRNKRRKTKKTRVVVQEQTMQPTLVPDTEYHGVTVFYSEATIPVDMKK